MYFSHSESGFQTFLWSATLICGQVLYDHQVNNTNPPFDYAKIAELLQTPLFRGDPSPPPAETVSSYLPKNYDVQPNEDYGGLALELQPPKPEAKNVFVLLNKPVVGELPTYQSLPSLNFQPVCIMIFFSMLKVINMKKESMF